MSIKLPSKESIELIIGYKIEKETIYQNAFVHKSAIKESGMRSNERLEFMGDAVLSMVVAKYLFNTYEQEDEGFMTKMRTKIVEGKKLAELAKKLKMNELVVMNEKAMRNEWNNNPRILEDVLESLIGSIFIDKGIEYAETFILKIIDDFVNSEEIKKDTNYKDVLTKYVKQNNVKGSFEYKCICNSDKKFTTQIVIDGKSLGEGTGTTKKESEQNAARQVLKCMNEVF